MDGWNIKDEKCKQRWMNKIERGLNVKKAMYRGMMERKLIMVWKQWLKEWMELAKDT